MPEPHTDPLSQQAISNLGLMDSEAQQLDANKAGAAVETAETKGGDPHFFYGIKDPTDWEEFKRNAVVASKMMAENQYNFAAMKEDKDEMSYLERWSNSLANSSMIDRATEDLRELSRKRQSGHEPTEEEWLQAEANIETIRGIGASRDPKNEPTEIGIAKFLNESVGGFLDAIPDAVDEFATMVGASTVVGATSGGIIGGILGAVSGGPAGAVFGAMEGVKLGSAAGLNFSVGSAPAIATTGALSTGAEMYRRKADLDYIVEEIRARKEGREFDQERTQTAIGASMALHGVALSLAATPIGQVFGRIAGAISSRITQLSTASNIASGAINSAVSTAVNVAEKTGIGRGVVEGAGALVAKSVPMAKMGAILGYTGTIIDEAQSSAIESIVLGKSNDEVIESAANTAFSAETQKKAIRGARDGAIDFVKLGVALAPMEYAAIRGISKALSMPEGSARARISSSVRGSKTIAAVTSFVQKGKLAKRSPSLAKRYMGESFPGQTISINLDVWDAYWTSKGINPKQKAAEIFGRDLEYQRAEKSISQLSGIEQEARAPLEIPLPEYAIKIANTEHGPFFWEHSKLSPTDLTAHDLMYLDTRRIEQAKEAASAFRKFGEEIKKEGISPEEQYAKYIDLLNSDAIGNWSRYAEKAWDLLPQAAKDASDSAGGIKTIHDIAKPTLTSETGGGEQVAGLDFGRFPKEDAPFRHEQTNAQLVKQSVIAGENAFKADTIKDGVRESVRLGLDTTTDYPSGFTKEYMIENLGFSESRANEVIKMRREMLKASRDFAAEKALKLFERQVREQKKRADELKPEILRRMDEDHGYVAYSVLARGKFPSGEKIAKRFNLSTDELIRTYGEEFVNGLPKKIHSKNRRTNITLNDASGRLGFSTPEQMLDAIISRGEPNIAADVLAAQAVAETNGPASLYRELVEQEFSNMHEGRANSRRIAVEANSLTSKETRSVFGDLKKKSRKAIARYRKEAADLIEKTKISDLNPDRYLEAMKQNAKLALDSAERGDFESHYRYRTAELAANELHMRAVASKKAISAAYDKAKRMQKPSSQKGLTMAGADYVNAANLLIRTIDQNARVDSKIATSGELESALQNIYAETGVQIDSPGISVGRSPSELTVGELSEMSEVLNQIRHAKVKKTKAIIGSKKSNRELVVDVIADQIQQNLGINVRKSESINMGLQSEQAKGLRKLWEGVQRYVNRATIMPFFLRTLDGGLPNGPVQKILYKPLLSAEAKKYELLKYLNDSYAGIARKHLTRDDLITASSRKSSVYVPETGRSWNLAERISLLLHSGTEHGRVASLRERGLDRSQMRAVIDTLEERHVRFAEDYFRMNDDPVIWDQVVGVEQRVRGRTPEKVEPVDIETKYGTIRGGYHPVKYQRRDTKTNVAIDQLMDKGHSYGATPMTRRGYAESRKGVPKGAMARLDLNVIQEHFGELAHDIAYREAIQGTWSLLKDDRVHGMFERVSTGMGNEARNWLRDLARDRDVPNDSGPLSSMLGMLRRGAQVNAMVWNAPSVLSQISGLPNAVHEVGLLPILKSIRDINNEVTGSGNLLAIQKIWKKFAEIDPRLEERFGGGWDRDAQEAFDFLQKANAKKRFLVEIPGLSNNEYFTSLKYFVGMSQAMIDTIVYKAAFEKAINGQQKNIRAGDIDSAKDFAWESLRKSQGASELMFKPAFMRNQSEAGKTLTMFITPQAAMLNQAIEATRLLFGKVRTGELSPKVLAAYAGAIAATVFLPQMIYDLIRGQLFKEDTEETLWNIANAPTDLLPIVRDVRSAAKYEHGIETPVSAIVNKAIRQYAKWTEGRPQPKPSRGRGSKRKGKALTDRDIRDLAWVTGSIAGLPGNAIGRLMSYLRALSQDRVINQEQLDPIDHVYNALMKGARKGVVTPIRQRAPSRAR